MIAAVAFGIIALSCVVQIVYAVRRRPGPDPVSHYLLLGGALLLFGVTVYRSIRISFIAVTNTYEALLFFSAAIALLLFAYRVQRRIRVLPLIVLGATVVTIGLLALASSPIAPSTIRPPIPALRSSWLVLHVTFTFIGEAFFTVAFAASIYFLALKDEEKRNSTDRIIYTTIAIGYPFFTLGALIFGAVWAKFAWGAYWSWDPKETWALMTWLVYTAYLHTRLVRKLRGRTSAILSIVGYAFMLFTFFGVNYLLPGLHSYA